MIDYYFSQYKLFSSLADCARERFLTENDFHGKGNRATRECEGYSALQKAADEYYLFYLRELYGEPIH